jgi:hypothetical protein
VPYLTRTEALAIKRYVEHFTGEFRREVAEPLAAQLRGIQPGEVVDLVSQLALLERSLEVRTKQVRVHDAHRPLLKRVLIDQRRAVAKAVDVPLQKVLDGQVVKQLRRELLSLVHLMSGGWFEETEALRVPALTDYLSIRHAEAALPDRLELPPRQYDEKFHILEAPSLFLPDLAYYRRRCGFRDAAAAPLPMRQHDHPPERGAAFDVRMRLRRVGQREPLVDDHAQLAPRDARDALGDHAIGAGVLVLQ